ncbi:MAG TPA: tetratricopeptide repeat protein [Candidatus Eisenbacteria bacterium]|nr:tetratricopeptide repeat protein [Candidatus Eisenbacteria bacterium]
MRALPRQAHHALLVAALLLASGCGGAGAAGGARPASIDPAASPASLVALADSAARSGDANLARRALERASEIAPSDPEVRLGYGRYYVAIRRYADAKVEFERAASLDPRNPEPHVQLGIAYLEAGDRTEAHRSLARALRLDPAHAGALAAIRPILEERYRAAGIPPEYAELPARSSVSRGEIGVMLAVELGVDPDRVTWREDAARRTDWPALDAAWGSRWLRASVARGWIAPFADRNLHLDDPLTRGALSILVSELLARSPASRPEVAAAASFPDLGPRHYLGLAAARASGLGLPARDGGRFEPQALATGSEALSVVRGLARSVGALPVVSSEP